VELGYENFRSYCHSPVLGAQGSPHANVVTLKLVTLPVRGSSLLYGALFIHAQDLAPFFFTASSVIIHINNKKIHENRKIRYENEL
jgi:hypothetical protein